MSGRLVEASVAHVSKCPWGVVVRVKVALPSPTSRLCPWGAAVVFCSSYFSAVRFPCSFVFPLESTVFITAVPNTKLCAWGEEDSGGLRT